MSRPPTWMLGLACGAVVAGAMLLVVAWQTTDIPLHSVGYVLGCVVTIVLVALYFQLDKRRATSAADYRAWSGSVPAMRGLLIAGFVVGAAHDDRLRAMAPSELFTTVRQTDEILITDPYAFLTEICPSASRSGDESFSQRLWVRRAHRITVRDEATVWLPPAPRR